ncbi:pilus assembly protein TadG-related protein [Natronohydrobacter thiooxidans]|uniref:pilus assembly protein TadG-related protein n=1 Tax=Natronohydrobacter thiooxidans TaxID=87172 RepID=UPI0008FF1647|nr:pilus assembly protein TadG-related protein [Natronohydrobacter thiooxidans]
MKMVILMARSCVKTLKADICGALQRYRREEDGAILIFGLIAFVLILMVGGIAVDMMRYESERVRLQGTADRAVLAAAMMRENPANPEAEDVVRSYFAAEGLQAYISDPDSIAVISHDGVREVRVAPRARMDTTFMRLSGVDQLQMNLLAAASESLAEIQFEIVMVLDVSWSMDSNNRMANLRQAAIDFVQTMLPEDNDGRVAITFVPYSTEVILPPGVLNYFHNLTDPLSGNTNNAFCLDFENWTDITNSIATPMFRRTCSLGVAERGHLPQFVSLEDTPVRPYVRSRTEAINYINSLGPSWGTSIDLGVRVGGLFFDPTLNPVIGHLIDNNQVAPVFSNRPYGWNQPMVYRAMIIMTDGENCCFPPAVPSSHPAVRKPSLAVQDADTLSTCNALKAQSVNIYAVAFEAPPAGEALMEACASAPSFYFNSSGEELVAAFQNIATHIQTQALRLTQ